MVLGRRLPGRVGRRRISHAQRGPHKGPLRRFRARPAPTGAAPVGPGAHDGRPTRPIGLTACLPPTPAPRAPGATGPAPRASAPVPDEAVAVPRVRRGRTGGPGRVRRGPAGVPARMPRDPVGARGAGAVAADLVRTTAPGDRAVAVAVVTLAGGIGRDGRPRGAGAAGPAPALAGRPVAVPLTAPAGTTGAVMVDAAVVRVGPTAARAHRGVGPAPARGVAGGLEGGRRAGRGVVPGRRPAPPAVSAPPADPAAPVARSRRRAPVGGRRDRTARGVAGARRRAATRADGRGVVVPGTTSRRWTPPGRGAASPAVGRGRRPGAG